MGVLIWCFCFRCLFSVQSLFPGLWLSEVTLDSYKVPESAENGKVIALSSVGFWSCLVAEKILFHLLMSVRL